MITVQLTPEQARLVTAAIRAEVNKGTDTFLTNNEVNELEWVSADINALLTEAA